MIYCIRGSIPRDLTPIKMIKLKPALLKGHLQNLSENRCANGAFGDEN